MRTAMVLFLTLASVAGCTAGSEGSSDAVAGNEAAGDAIVCTDGVAYRYRTDRLGGALEGLDDGNGLTAIVITTEIATDQTVTAEYVGSDGAVFGRFDGHPGPFENGTWYDATESNNFLTPSPLDAPLGTHRTADSMWAALDVDTTSFDADEATHEATVSARSFEDAVGHDVTASFANPDDTIDIRIGTDDDGCIVDFARRIPGEAWADFEILEMSPDLSAPEVTDPQPWP